MVELVDDPSAIERTQSSTNFASECAAKVM